MLACSTVAADEGRGFSIRATNTHSSNLVESDVRLFNEEEGVEKTVGAEIVPPD